MKPMFFILIVLWCAALPAWAGAAPLEKVRLQLKWLHQFQFAGYYAALEQGYYRQAGLDVEIREVRGNESAVDVVVRGEAEYGVHGSDLVVERARGRPVKALAVIFQHSPMVLLARQDRGIDSLHDLANRRLLLGPDAAELVAYLKSEGVPYQLPRTHQSFDLKALMEGEVDAMPAYSTDEVYLLQQAGIPYSQFSPRAAGIDFYGDVLFASDQEVKAHPQRARRFVEASLRGWYYALSHREEVARLIHARYSQRHSLEHLLFEAEHTRRLMTPDLVEIGHMHPGRWRHIADTYAELGMMPAGFPLDGFFLPGKAEPEDHARLYLSLGTALLLAGLAAWLALYQSRLKRALGEEARTSQGLREALERQKDTDDLTGLPNRRFFLAQLERELRRRQRYPHPLSLMVLDLDHFRALNASRGHGAGDAALKACADVLQGCLRAQDFAGRVGSEEFAVLLPETGADLARPVAERMRARMAQASIQVPGGLPAHVSLSIGLAQARDGDDVNALSRRADQALRAAQAAGHDRVACHDDLPDAQA